jgi:hypothetical protein
MIMRIDGCRGFKTLEIQRYIYNILSGGRNNSRVVREPFNFCSSLLLPRLSSFSSIYRDNVRLIPLF